MDVAVGHGSATQTLSVSYVTDAIPDLLAVCIRLLEGSTEETLDWAGEPAVYRWSIASADGVLDVRLDEYEDDPDRHPGTHRTRMSSFEVETVSFTQSVAVAAARLLSGTGEDRYREEWLDHFPTTQLRTLERRIVSRSPATLHLGRSGDHVIIELADAQDEEGRIDCGIEVHSREFTASVATALRLDHLTTFLADLGRLCGGGAGEALLRTTDESCRFTVSRPDGGGSAHVRAVVADGTDRVLTFSVPIRNQDIELTQHQASDVLRRLHAAAPES